MVFKRNNNYRQLLVVSLLIVSLFIIGGCSSDDDTSANAKLLIKVTDNDTNPLENAQVNVDGVGSKETDSEGVVEFSGLKEQKYQVEISKTGYKTKTENVSANSKDQITSFKLESGTTLVDTNEYIDINNNKTKFLFKTDVGSQVNFYLGSSKDNLEQVKSNSNFSNDGLIVDGLTGGTNYYYQVEVVNGDNTAKSDVLPFDKLDRTNDWQPAEWAKEAVFYEVFVRSFYDSDGDGIGDFNGLKEKIPYFKELGVDALWLMPINDSPSYHGYDVQDYYNTEPDYGTKEEFQEFLKAAHKAGLKVVMDLVVNHSSTKNNWFVEAAKGEENEYRDYYIWNDQFDDIDESNPLGEEFPSPWYDLYTEGDYYHAIFWDQMPDLNLRNAQVRQEMKEVAKYWLDPNGDGDFSDGVNGFRLDAALHIDDKDPQVTHNFWQEFNTAVKDVNPDAFLVGENWTDTATMAKYFKDLDSSFNFPLAYKLLNMALGKDVDILGDLNDIHTEYEKYSNQFIDSTFLRNHDQPRVASTLGDHEKSKLAASLLFTMPGTPFVYYGEEIGQLGYGTDDNIREPFDWYADAKGDGMTDMSASDFYNSMKFTTEHDSISVEEQRDKKESIFEHYKKLISIRKNNPAFFTADNYSRLSLGNSLYGYQVSGKNNLYVVHNNTSDSYELSLSDSATELLTETSYNAGDTILLDDYNTVILNSTAGLDISSSQIEDKVSYTFKYESSGTVDSVALAGEFNEWDDTAKSMTDADGDGVYQATVDLIPGDYEYKFVVDGDWIVDPQADYFVPDMTGGKNGVVDVE